MIDAMIETARRLDPELFEKVDRIAEMIDPGAFARWHATTDPDAPPVPPTTRQEYMQSRARSLAYRILQYLEIAPALYDWPRLFEEYHGEGHHEEER